MKKKVTALFAAMIMALSCFILPAQAEETKYQLGDVNMDGKVDCIDAMLVQINYTDMLAGLPASLTPEQMALGNVDGKTHITKSVAGYTEAMEMPADINDALIISVHYVRFLAGYVETMEETVAFFMNPDSVLEISEEADNQFHTELRELFE